MAPLPYVRPGARVAFEVVLAVFGVLEWRIRLRSRLSRGGPRPHGRDLAVLFVTIAAGVGAGFALAADVPAADIPAGRLPVFVAGMVLMVAGIALRQWAIALLGGLFTVDVRVRPGQTVVDTGPYRWVRHPSYTGLILTFVGMGLALGNWAALGALAVLPTAGLVARIRFEEAALLAGLGEPYRRFAAGRARLLPGVW